MQDQEDFEQNPYIQNHLSPILESMVFDIYTKKPEPNQLVNFMIDWLNQNGNQYAQSQSNYQSKQRENQNDKSFSEEEEEDDVFDLPEVLANQKPAFRTSVSAECYGQFNKEEQYEAKFFQKTDEQIKQLKQKLEQNFLFKDLDIEDQQIVVQSFQESLFSKGDKVITEGDDGDCLYFVYDGKLSCYKQDKLLKQYQPGDAFGELALLYNAPRAATIIADTTCVLYQLDRSTFNHIVKDSSIKKRKRYEDFLSTVEVLNSLNYMEKLKLADALKPMIFKDGEYVVKQVFYFNFKGDKGNQFYIVEQGVAIASKVIKAGTPPQTVYTYQSGDYFGELSLLKNTPRAASILAQGTLRVVSVDRETFNRLLGPLDEILKRNFSRYEKYMS